MILRVLVVLSLFFTHVYSSHFYGGFFTAEPSAENTTHYSVKFYVRLGFKRSWVGSQSPAFEPTRITYCDQTTIANGQHIAPYYYVFCDVGCLTLNEAVGLTDIACISYSVVNDWSYGENSFTYDLAKNTNYEVYYYGASWISLNQYTSNYMGTGAAWSLRLKINTNKRTDTNTMNNSPRTLVSPIFIIRNGMLVSLHIPQFDTDGDIVKCRWAIYALGECESICEAVPFATLNKTSCTLDFNLTSYAFFDGWYGAALQIEDFQTQSSLTPLSSTPLQFLIKVVSSVSTCTIPPKIDFYYCMLTEVNKPFTMTIKATAGCSSNTVTEITITGPTGLTYTETAPVSGTTDQYSSTLTWTPTMSQLDEQIICVTAMDDSPLSSDVSCVTVLVYNVPNTLNAPALVTGSGTPSGIVTQTSATFKAQVNKAIARPTRASYIYIKDLSGTEYLRFDMKNSSAVSIAVNSTTNYSTISFTVPLNTLTAGSYYVAFDNPFAISSVKYSKYCTQVEVSGIDDPSFWNFTIPAAITTTTTSKTTTTTLATGSASSQTTTTTSNSASVSTTSATTPSAGTASTTTTDMKTKAQTTARLANSQTTTSEPAGCTTATCQALSSVFSVLGGIALGMCSTGLTILGIVFKRRKRRVSDDKDKEPEPEHQKP